MLTVDRLPAGLVIACIAAMGTVPAWAQTQTDTLVLAATSKTVTWAAVYQSVPARPDDPYLHVRVFEKDTGTPPWQFRLVAPHLAVTPAALAASRTGKKAKTYHYKDVEFRISYKQWLNDPQWRATIPVCTTEILRCLHDARPGQAKR